MMPEINGLEFLSAAKELMPNGCKCSECGSTEFKKETDIMDVWFDSGSTHESVLAERGLPEANMYLEGSDQYRGWFQSSLLTSIATQEKAPYEYTCLGFRWCVAPWNTKDNEPWRSHGIYQRRRTFRNYA